MEVLTDAANRGEPYDVAILDMQMPGMDGIELARRIKADPTIAHTRLLFLTSMVQHGNGGARAAGIEAYLNKPVRQGKLRAALALVMGRTTEEASDEDHGVHLVTRHDVHEVTAQHKPHVLLAEDNPVNQKVSVGMLEKLGYRVDVAADGLQVLEALSRQEYSAILMDVQMPNMDGHEATR